MHRIPSSIALVGTLFTLFAPPVAAGAEQRQPAVAPPATPKIAAACAQQVAAAAATADETTHVPHGKLELSGCVSDTSGIEHVVVRWNRGDTHGRICTDPVVVDGQWRCPWDTTRLPSGAYELELIAVDAAGNRGSSTRKYAIDDRQLLPQESPTPSPVTPATPVPPPAAAPAEPTREPDAGAAEPSNEPPTAETDAAVGSPTADADLPSQNFSAIQQLVVDRVAACENGGVEDRPTDDPSITTQRDQVQLVLDCLAPALELAGAERSSVRDEAPLPLSVLVEVADATARTELDDALPDTIAGVPVLVEAPIPSLDPLPSDVVARNPQDTPVT